MLRKISVMVAGVQTSVTEDKLTKKANGDFEKHYNADMSLDVATIEAEYIESVVSDAVQVIEEHIQEQIDIYNLNNGVKFTSVDSCYKYTSNPMYPHYQFCVDIVVFAIDVWEAGRTAQATIMSTIPPAPTPEEFKAMLPIWVN